MAVNKKNVSILAVIVLAIVFTTVYFVFINKDKAEPQDEPESKDITEKTKIPAMPESLAEAEEALKDPQDLLAVLNEYFTIEQRPGLLAYSPEEFLEKRGGNAHDFAVFAAHIMWQNDIESGIIRFDYQVNDQEKAHSLAIFRDKDGPKYFASSDKEYQILPGGGSFKDLVQVEAKRLKVNAFKYTFFPAEFGIIDLSEPAPGRSWIEI